MTHDEKLKSRLDELRLQKVELEKTLPAHSIPVSLVVELEAIEEKIKQLERMILN